VPQRDIETALAHKAFQATGQLSTGQPTAGRPWRRAINQPGRFLVAISERQSRAASVAALTVPPAASRLVAVPRGAHLHPAWKGGAAVVLSLCTP
jgi:hypothetical protein